MGATCHKPKIHHTQPKPSINSKLQQQQNTRLCVKLIIEKRLIEKKAEQDEKETDFDLTPPKLIFQSPRIKQSPMNNKKSIQNESLFGKKTKHSDLKSPHNNPLGHMVK